ncbi:hypothetical protein [Streptosporangium saharense]|uniref:hypothetical protein n=1 Tax=Streptosporangium saharense TaxID=1706840 RepID=UPI00343A51E8
MAFRNSEDRSAEVAFLAEKSREMGFASLIVYGDTWAVSCEDDADMAAVQRALGGSIEN